MSKYHLCLPLMERKNVFHLYRKKKVARMMMMMMTKKKMMMKTRAATRRPSAREKPPLNRFLRHIREASIPLLLRNFYSRDHLGDLRGQFIISFIMGF